MRLVRQAVLLSAVLATGCSSRAGLFVTAEGSVPEPIADLLVEGNAVDGAWTDESVFDPPDGETEITLPTTFAIDLRGPRPNVEGMVQVCVTARGSTGVSLATGCDTQLLTPGEITEFVVFLGGDLDGGMDAGPDSGPDAGDAMADASDADAGATESGTDAGTDAGVCGDGTRTGGEDCDQMDLGGENCVSLGFSGGMLACDSTCMFDVTMCAGPPTVPIPRLPMNNAYIGSVHVAGTLAPTFVWEPSVVGGGAMIDYELQYGTDPVFSAPLTTIVMAMFPNHQPSADLTVSVAAPVGARYYWRVRACAGAMCSMYSPTWYFNLGRSDRDFNGDGYADAIVGAFQNDSNGTDAGRAYVYLGASSGLDNTPDGILTGEAAGDFFGRDVATAGDVNSDGFADVIIGAWGNDASGMDAGRAYVFLGGPGGAFDAMADGVLNGAAADDLFGTSVSGAGDVDGDGFSDVLVGATQDDTTSAGAAYLFFGGPGMMFDAVPDAMFAGDSIGDRFGISVSSAGDTNGDGFADLLVGAAQNGSVPTGSGKAYVYLGGVVPGATPSAVITGEAVGDYFGVSVATAGDVNGDGFGDVVIGATRNDAGGADAGRAYVFLGAASGASTMAAGVLTGELAGDRFGSSVASGGDVNDDGLDDVVVGAPLNDFAGAGAGRAYLFYGAASASFDTTADGTMTPMTSSFSLGKAVSGAGDVDGDNVEDVLVGAPGFGGGGEVRLYLGGSGSFDPTADSTMTSENALDNFGSALE